MMSSEQDQRGGWTKAVGNPESGPHAARPCAELSRPWTWEWGSLDQCEGPPRGGGATNTPLPVAAECASWFAGCTNKAKLRHLQAVN